MNKGKQQHTSEEFWNLPELEQFRHSMVTENGDDIAPYLSPDGWLTYKDDLSYSSFNVLNPSCGFIGKDFFGKPVHWMDSWDRVRTGWCVGKRLVKFADLPEGIAH